MDVMALDDAIPAEEFSTEWENYGDVNPEPHGGRFIKWDTESEQWVIVETRGESIQKHFYEPQDVWVDGDPAKGFTDSMENILEALHENGGRRGPSPEPDSPRFMENAAYYVADLPRHTGPTHGYGRGGGNVKDGETYEEAIARFGVDDYE